MIFLKASSRSSQPSRSFARSLLLRTVLLAVCMGTALNAAPAQAAPTAGRVPVRALALALLDQPPVHEAAPGKPESNSQEEQEKKFRHSATIEWFSRLLHLDVETTASIFEWINFAVIALAVGIPLFRFLPKVFRKRTARLSADIEVAQARTFDANERLAAVERKLAGLDAEISSIRQQVEEAMRGDEIRARAALEEETARIVASAEHEIAMAGTQAQRSLRQFAANLAIDRALTRFSLDAETDRALIAEFASDIAHSGQRDGKGAQN